MPRFTSAEKFSHDMPSKTGVLMIQLGTPDAPDAASVRRYLREFLSDPRVVEIPRPIWWLILNLFILPRRPAQSAKKYASIWTDKGSPLLINTRDQAALLRGYLGNEGLDLEVAFAMRYGNPSVADAMRKLREQRVTRLLVLPMYPQFAGSTTASVYDAVFSELRNWREQPELRLIRGFHDDEAYLDAMAAHVRKRWAHDGPPDIFLMSFHGVPKRSLLAGDPYHCECHATARLLAKRLDLPEERWRITFQSRFGRAEWLQPYTDKTLAALGADGVKRVDVFCPGFVSDCLETLEEIAMEAKDSFLEAGGSDFRYIPCLNSEHSFAQALHTLVRRHLAGWPVQRPALGEASELVKHELGARAERARRLGAPA